MKTTSIYAFLLLWTVGAAFSAPIGKLGAIEGEVSIVRNGQFVKSQLLVEGFYLEDFDTVSTGAQSFVELVFLPSTGVRASVKLASQTLVYLELSALKKEQTATLELVSGSVSIQSEKLTGKNSLVVRTESLAATLRGNSFRVTTSSQGDVLVSAASGKAECQIDSKSLFAEPGTVVEALWDEKKLRSKPVNVSTIDSFESKWLAERQGVLKAGALSTFKKLALRYQLKFSEAQRSYERLIREAGKTIDLWNKQENDATVSEPKALVVEKGTVKGPMINVRRALSGLERYAFRLKEIRSVIFQTPGYDAFEISRGYKVKDFYAQFEKDEPNLTAWTRTARTIFKFYSDRNEGSFPSDVPTLDVTKESDFFH